jgi:Immunity protein 26
MAPRRWMPGTVVRKQLGDGFTYYARLLNFPWAAFYDFRTDVATDDLGEITAHPALFTVAAHKDLLADGEWEPVGRLPLDGSLRPPREQFIQDPIDPSDCQIIDDQGNMRAATLEECEGLEAAAVWEPEHIGDRLMDHYAGRPNIWLEDLKLRRE